ncbi:hypothetical protein AAFN86_19910 [Roseomonas sp. CAU 1739]|uniref:hypothetical protein n=1 Tax=Roseomonas sp. CAU 1739 TaxID=3140364 RepID=UPI00325BEB4C
MDEPKRQARNAQRLGDCRPAFAARLARTILRWEDGGLRPRTQDAWHAIEHRVIAFNTGHAQVTFGFHNVTGLAGQKASLAADLLDDTAALKPGAPHIPRLAAAARTEGLDTDVPWGLPAALRAGTDAAGDFKAPAKVRPQPRHVEPTGIAIEEAMAGKLPT